MEDPRYLENANFLQLLSFSWINPLIEEGKHKKLEESDLYPTPENFKSSFLCDRVDKSWENAVEESKKLGKKMPKFWKHALNPFKIHLLKIAAFILFEIFQRVFSAFILRQLVRFLQGISDDKSYMGYVYAVILGFLGFLYPCIHHQYWNLAAIVGWNVRITSMTMVNRKLLKLSAGALSNITTGHCINLMSNDVRRFDELFMFIHFLWAGPLELIIVTVLIALELNIYSALAGSFALILLIPIQMAFGKFFANQRRKTVEFTDKRVKMTGEVLHGILAVKMFAWESAFSKMIEAVRKKERKNISKAGYIKAFNEALYFSSSVILSFITFITFHYIGGHLSPPSVFYVISLMQLPRLWMCVFFPVAIEFVAEARVSFSRLQKFFELQEMDNLESKNKSFLKINLSANQNQSQNQFESNNSNSKIATNSTNTNESNDYDGDDNDKDINNENMTNLDHNFNNFENKNNFSIARLENATFTWNVRKSNYKSMNVNRKRRNYFLNSKFKSKSNQNNGDGKIDDWFLKKISFELRNGELFGISGKVGAGKSTLLSALLGDIEMIEGKTEVKSSQIAYAAQKPFIIAGSLRENILFGSEFDEIKYKKVIEACALIKDIAELPEKDLTEIGERGINLSGGQKARISLARVCYSNSKFVLLDDPLSAVDPSVGKHLFDFCINGLLKDRARILVTHQIQYLPRCDKVMLLDDGEVKAIGKFDELQSNFDFGLIFDHKEEENDDQKDKNKNSSSENANTYQENENSSLENEEKSSKKGNGGSLVSVENREEGNVKLHVYFDYTKNIGIIATIFLILFLVIGQAANCICDWYLAFWSRKSNQNGKWITIYIFLLSFAVFISFYRAGMYFYYTIKASSKIHTNMIHSVFSSPLFFFHSNPSGRILNRFSADQGILDDLLPLNLFNFLQTLSMSMGAFVIVSIGIPWIILALLPLFLVFFYFRSLFIKTSRDLKRLEAVSRSPIYAHYSATIQGLSTIRAFRVESQFENEFMKKIDENGKAYFAWISCTRWLAFRLDLICGLVIFFAALFATLAKRQLSSNLIGLALTYTLQLSGLVQWAVRQSAEVENMFTGVERALEYTKLEAEEKDKKSKAEIPDGWPSKGHVAVHHLSVKYRTDLPFVLKNLNFEIQENETCGIVGRTGAGKSSLMLSFFRLVKFFEGRILIDGVDISLISLYDLRRHVMAIPQDPVLFGNSLRFNLDPFMEYKDEDVWNALSVVQLKKKVSNFKSGLDTSMAEFGENFSVGERQLICLARAVLQNQKILIMDEATANIDLETDALIQKTLRTKFKCCTLLVIAHRMDTIIDADKILVLDHGEVAEFGSPKELLSHTAGYFSEMVCKTGQASEAALRKRVFRAADGVPL